MHQSQVGRRTIDVIVSAGNIITGKIQQRYQAQEKGAENQYCQGMRRDTICIQLYRTTFLLSTTSYQKARLSHLWKKAFMYSDNNTFGTKHPPEGFLTVPDGRQSSCNVLFLHSSFHRYKGLELKKMLPNLLQSLPALLHKYRGLKPSA